MRPIAAHLFVMYFGMMSMITPPVALAAYAAASLAQADPMATGFEATRFGWSTFIVPFLFVVSPALLLIGDAASVALAVTSATIGVWLVSIGVVGQLILKTAMTRVGPLGLRQGQAGGTVAAIGLNPLVWAGLGLYGFSLLFWLVGLSHVELGYAFPFFSLSYVLILASSWALLGESIGWMRLLGVVCICLGVTIVAAG